MKHLLKSLFVLGIMIIVKFDGNAQNDNTEDYFVWDKEKKEIQNLYRNDPTKWDMDMFDGDKKSMAFISKPLYFGTFPVPIYDLVGKSSFKGVGNYSGHNTIGDKLIFYNSFFSGRGILNERYITEDQPNEVFFIIISIIDSIDTVEYSHFTSHISSRNHPNYVGQGTIGEGNPPIEYISFMTADRNSYAIVNMRLFDLSIGKLVLIAPQKDGTLRSLQLDCPPLSSKELDAFVDELLKKKEVISFFMKEGNI